MRGETELSAFLRRLVVWSSWRLRTSTCLEMARSSFLASTPAFATCWALRSALPIAAPIFTATCVSLLFLAIPILPTPSEKNSSYTRTVPFGTFCLRLHSFAGLWRGNRGLRMTWRLGLCDSSLPRKSEGPPEAGGQARGDAEKIQGFNGERDSGDRHRGGRRRRADLRGVRGCAARRVSFDGADVRGDARGRGGAPRPSVRDVPAAIRGAHSANPAGKRERVFTKEAGVAGAPAGREHCEEAGRVDGDGGGAVLRASGEQDGGRFHARIAEQARG